MEIVDGLDRCLCLTALLLGQLAVFQKEIARRPDVRLVKRQFPLDSDCNPVLKRRMHPGACDLALAAAEGSRARAAADAGRIVVMDRFLASTIAYARARGVAADFDSSVASSSPRASPR